MTLEEALADIESKLNQALEVAIDNAFLVTLKDMEGRIKQRIHNRGNKSDNSRIGNYSERYAAVRRRRGRQANYVDLQLEGRLLNALQVGRVQDKNVLMINPNLSYGRISGAELADYFEERYGSIWEPSEDELQAFTKIFPKALERELKRVFQ